VGLKASSHLAISLNVEHFDFTIRATNNNILARLIEGYAVNRGVANISRENLRYLADVPQLANAVRID